MSDESVLPTDTHVPLTITRSVQWAPRSEQCPISTTESKVIQGRIGTLNTTAVHDHKPYTLKLLRIRFAAQDSGWVMIETWETVKP